MRNAKDFSFKKMPYPLFQKKYPQMSKNSLVDIVYFKLALD